MVKDADISSQTQVTTPLVQPGKAHGGFAWALALAGPVMMVAAMAAAGVVMAGAQGATGFAWIAGTSLALALVTGLGIGWLRSETEG